MKLLKTLFLFLAMMYAGNSYAQTKEETIEWLNRNGKSMIETLFIIDNKLVSPSIYFLFDNIVKDTISFRVQSNDDHYKEHRWRDIDIPLGSILYQDVNSLVKTTFTKNSDYGYFAIQLLPNSGYVKGGEYNYHISTFYFPYKKTNEENAKRVIKAIMHLAKLSGAKENKQTF